MADLREQLREILQGRVCLVGVGNVESGDDGLGVRLAERMEFEVRSPKSKVRSGAADIEVPDFGLRTSDFGLEILIAGRSPERHMAELANGTFDTVLFLDAVEFGAAPGSVVLLNSSEIKARFPQISTHKLSLGLLAQMVETSGRTKAWLLGVQPESLKAGERLSASVRRTLKCLTTLLQEQPEEVLA